MARTPIPPGPVPGALTGSRPPGGLTVGDKHLASKLNMITAQLVKLNGRTGPIQTTNTQLKNLNSSIQTLVTYFTTNQRAAALAARAAQRGGQQTNTSTGTQTNQSNQVKPNQNTQSAGGLFSRVGDYIKRGGLAALAPLFAVPLLGTMMRGLFTNKAAMKTIGFILADDIVDFVMGKKGESELRDSVEDIFNPSAALGLGFLGSLINKRLMILGGVIGLFATEENVQKFDRLMNVLETNTWPKLKANIDKFSAQISELFGVSIPSLETGFKNLSDNVGNALTVLTDLLEGDYSTLFTPGGETLAFGGLLLARLKFFRKRFKGKNPRAIMARIAVDSLIGALGLSILSDSKMPNDDVAPGESPNLSPDGPNAAKSDESIFSKIVGNEIVQDTALFASVYAAVKGGAAGSKFAYSAAKGFVARSLGIAAAAGTAGAAAGSGAAAGGGAAAGSSYASNISKTTKLRNALVRLGYQFDKTGRMLFNGKPASNKVMMEALKKVGGSGLVNLLRATATRLAILGGVTLLFPAAAAGAGYVMLLATAVGLAYIAYTALPPDLQAAFKSFLGSSYEAVKNFGSKVSDFFSSSDDVSFSVIGASGTELSALLGEGTLVDGMNNSSSPLSKTFAASDLQTVPNSQKRMLLEQLTSKTSGRSGITAITDSSIKNSNNSTNSVQNTYYGGVGSSADNNGIMSIIFGNGTPLSYAHGGIALR